MIYVLFKISSVPENIRKSYFEVNTIDGFKERKRDVIMFCERSSDIGLLPDKDFV